ncbi:MAG: tetratricopeptide repeat protein [Treponema sp.]|jgi:tetratricopeptide (TPR) repeat protein|nr:tetratricopeptide repeat protein [Treponema sp.]
MGIEIGRRAYKLFAALVFMLGAGVFSAAETAEDTEAILTEVSRLMTRREYLSALELFDKMDSSVRHTPEIQLLRASLLNSTGRFADARAIASGIAASDPKNIDALLVLASSASLEGKEREQRTLLERVVSIDPKNLNAITELGYIALRAQSLRTAAAQFEKALAIDGDYREALVGRAVVYRYTNDPKRSEQLLNRAIRQNPQWVTPFHERARLYKGAGFLQDALKDLDTAKEIEPDNYWVCVDRAAVLIELNRRKDALEDLDRAVILDPGGFLAYVYRAGIRDESGDYKGAEQDYTAIMKIKPDYYFAAEGLGIIKMRNNQYIEARDAFLAAYRQAPKELNYAMLAAINWMKGGRMSDPKQFLAQVLRTVPRDSPDWHIIRLYHDLSGDSDMVDKINREQNLDVKSKMMFYIAHYYDARGNKSLANKFFLEVKDMNRIHAIEWKINDFILKERGLNDL